MIKGHIFTKTCIIWKIVVTLVLTTSFSYYVIAQQAAQVVWPLTSPTYAAPTTSGNITATSQTANQLSGRQWTSNGVRYDGFEQNVCSPDNDYLEFTITPSNCYGLTITNISYYYRKAWWQTFQACYILKYFIGSSSEITINQITFTNNSLIINNISNQSIFVPNGNTITFRLYGATGDKDYYLYCKDFTVNGTTTIVPGSIGNISGNTAVCSGNSETYTIGNVVNSTNYVWAVTGGSINSGQGTTNISVTFGPGTSGNVSVYATNGSCSTSTKNLAITIAPQLGSIGTITGDNTVCNGDTVTYNIGAVNNATSYYWTAPDSFIGQGNTSITVYYDTCTSTAGNVKVKASNSCSSDSATTSISITPQLGTIGSIIGKSNVCYQASGEVYTISSVNGATGYTWTKPSDASIASGSGTNSINVNFGDSSGNITVTPYNSCFTGSTSSKSITVHPLMTEDSIGSAQSICYNTLPDTLYIITPASGGGSGYKYQWQVSENGTTGWTDITGGINSNYLPGSLTSDKYYRLKDSSQYNCGPVYSNVIKITVYDTFNHGMIGYDDTICYNTNAPAIQFTSSPSGGGGNYSYQWYSSTDNSGFSLMSSETNSSLSPGTLTDTMYYKCFVTSQYSCDSGFTNVVTITVTQPLPTTGTITGGSNVCHQASGESYSISPVIGAAYYIWSLPPGAGITSGDSTNSITVNFGSLSGTITVYPKNNCYTGDTSSIPVTIHAQMTANNIGSAQSICYNTQPALISQTESPTGGGGVYTYQWQESGTGSVGWIGISNANDSFFLPPILTQDKYFRLRVFSQYNCGPVFSNVIKITVFNQFNEGIIGGNDSICYNASPDTIKFTQFPSGADSNYSYQWLISTDSNNWSAISNADTLFYKSNNLIDTTFYSCKVTSTFGCGTDTTNVVKITVYPAFNSGGIGNNDTICHNTSSPAINIINNPSGSNGSYAYQWYKRDTASSTWTSVPNATGTSYNPGNLTITTFYKLFVSTISSYGKNCGSGYTDSIRIKVWDSIVAGIISDSDSICYNTQPDTLYQSVAPTGGGGSYIYQWQESNNGTSSWYDISGQLGTTYLPDTLTSDKYFRLKESSQYNCGPVLSNVLKITVFDSFNQGVIDSNATICYNTTAPTLHFSILPSGGGGSYNYQWYESTDNSSFTQFSGQTGSTLSPGALIQTMYYKCLVSSQFECDSGYTNVVTITVVPQIGNVTNINGDSLICAGDTVSYQISGVTNATNYVWTVPNGASIINGDSTTNITVDFGTAATGDIMLYAENSCFSSVRDSHLITITPLLGNIGGISGDDTLCYGDTSKIYIINPVNNATNYHWTIPSGASLISGQGSTNILVDFGTASQGHIKFRANNRCFADSTILATNIVPLVGNIGSISGFNMICYGDTGLIYKIDSVSGATEYYWTVFNMYNVIGDTFISVDFNTFTSGDIRVYAGNLCFRTAEDTLNFSIAPQVGNTGKISGKNIVCYQATSETYSINPVSGATEYVWTIPPGASFTGDSTKNSITIDFGTNGGIIFVYPKNRCFNGNTKQINVNLHPMMTQAIIGYSDTIFYSSRPDTLVQISPATGGGGGYTLQWQVSDDSLTGWLDVNGGTNPFYQPDTLIIDKFYRIKILSQYNCLVYSNVIKITVYSQLDQGYIGNDDTICYGFNAPVVKFDTLPSGGVNVYSYQWYESSNDINFTILVGETDSILDPSILTQDKYYKCWVGSGNDTFFTNSIKISVYDEYFGGKISIDTSVCYSYIPNSSKIESIAPPQGANSLYDYQWQLSTDGINFSDTIGQSSTSMNYVHHYQTTYYRLKYTNICGDRYSDTHIVTVHSLPLDVNLKGNISPCRNSSDVKYKTDSIYSGYSFLWNVSSGGEIVSWKSENTIRINWTNIEGTDTIYLRQIIDNTGCFKELEYIINKQANMAPDQVRLIKKPGKSNMLFTYDTSDSYHYQWGYSDLTTQKEFITENEGVFYHIYTEFNTNKYSYWLNTSIYYSNDTCITRNYYNSPFTGVAEKFNDNKTISLRVFPNPAENYIIVEINGDRIENHVIILRDIQGRILEYTLVENFTFLHRKFDVSEYSSGLYFIDVIRYDNQRRIVKFTIE